jgi:sortase A
MLRRTERARRILVATLLALGFWQLGQGAYIPAKAWLAQELMVRAWNRAGRGAAEPVPWPWADTWPVARLVAQDGAIKLIVLAGGSGRTLAFGPGHLSASPMPGEPGNIIIAGHRDTHFRFLKDLAVGEHLVLEAVDGTRHRYTVIDLDVLDARRASIAVDTEQSLLTLVTCFPIRSGGPLRYVVTAREDPPDTVVAASGAGLSSGIPPRP